MEQRLMHLRRTRPQVFFLLVGVVALFVFGIGRWSKAVPVDDDDRLSFIVKGTVSFTEFDDDAQFMATYRSLTLAEAVQSPYQMVEMYTSAYFGPVLVIDGAVMTTGKDEVNYHEMIAHVPLNYIPDAERVLVFGGGDGGTVRQVLQHPNVKEVKMVEIDRQVVEMSARYFEHMNKAFMDPRLELIYADGAVWAKERVAEGMTGTFDVILIDSTDFGPAVPLFSNEFFADCKELLKPGGAIVSNVDSPSWSLQSVAAVSRQMKAMFNHAFLYQVFIPTYTSGHYSFMMSSDTINPAVTKVDWDAFHAKDITCRYYTPSLHYGAFALPAFVNEVIRDKVDVVGLGDL